MYFSIVDISKLSKHPENKILSNDLTNALKELDGCIFTRFEDYVKAIFENLNILEIMIIKVNLT